MLTDIFAERYATVPIFRQVGEPERRLLVQTFRVLSEQVCPYFVDGKATQASQRFWTDLHSRISMELGLKCLAPLAYSYDTMVAARDIP